MLFFLTIWTPFPEQRNGWLFTTLLLDFPPRGEEAPLCALALFPNSVCCRDNLLLLLAAKLVLGGRTSPRIKKAGG